MEGFFSLTFGLDAAVFAFFSGFGVATVLRATRFLPFFDFDLEAPASLISEAFLDSSFSAFSASFLAFSASAAAAAAACSFSSSTTF